MKWKYAFAIYHDADCSNNPLIHMSQFPIAKIIAIIRHTVLGSNTYYGVVVGEKWQNEIEQWLNGMHLEKSEKDDF